MVRPAPTAEKGDDILRAAAQRYGESRKHEAGANSTKAPENFLLRPATDEEEVTPPRSQKGA